MKKISKNLVIALVMFNFIGCNSKASQSKDISCEGLFSLPKDIFDFHREWGTKLLLENDKAFNSKEYNQKILSVSRPGIVPSYTYGSNSNHLSRIYTDYIDYFSRTDDHFAKVIRFSNTGTEANNTLYEFAEHSYYKRTGIKAQRPNLLYFSSPYGGTFGRSAEISLRYEKDINNIDNFEIPTPTTKKLNAHLSQKELIELKKIELKALEFISEKVAQNKLEIGGIFIEPISVSNGLKFFRTEFLEQLRQLADELNVPIMADEIFTGGGRTGKFWAFSHYGTFRPDLFTFGKGLGVSGVAQITRQHVVNDSYVPRWKWPSWDNSQFSSEKTYPEVVMDNTSRLNPMQLVQALEILKRIVDDKLDERAQKIGPYLLQKVKNVARHHGVANEIYGIGTLIYAGKYTGLLAGKSTIIHYQGRWSAPLTIKREDIDKIFSY